jgi:hypothetical protein
LPKTKSLFSFPGNRFYRSQWKLLILAFGLLVIDIVIASSFRPGYNDSSLVGGLDGCLVDGSGSALLGTITVSGVKISTDANGCFFYPDLQPGIHNMVIHIGSQDWENAVQIKKGEAHHLGQIEIMNLFP